MSVVFSYILLSGLVLAVGGLILALVSSPKQKSARDIYYHDVSFADVVNGTLQKSLDEPSQENRRNGLEAKRLKSGKTKLIPNASVSRHSVRRVLRHW